MKRFYPNAHYLISSLFSLSLRGNNVINRSDKVLHLQLRRLPVTNVAMFLMDLPIALNEYANPRW
jgi:hypothetical protein